MESRSASVRFWIGRFVVGFGVVAAAGASGFLLVVWMER